MLIISPACVDFQYVDPAPQWRHVQIVTSATSGEDSPGCRGAGFPEENALCMLRIHRGGSSGSMLQRHSNGCLSELPRHRINQLCVEWDVKP